MLSAVVELTQVRRETLHIMSEEASSLIESIAVSSDNATLAYSELKQQVAKRLLNNARMIARLDSLGVLRESSLVGIAEENDLYRVNLFDPDGNKTSSSHEVVHEDVPELHQPLQFIQPVLDGREQELPHPMPFRDFVVHATHGIGRVTV